MSNWEEITNPDDLATQEAASSPFRDVAPVDGLVYEQQETSPELRFQQQQHTLPPPPAPRPAPSRPQGRVEEPWRPGGEVDLTRYRPRPNRANPVKVFLLGMFPLVVLVSLVAAVMRLYGFL